ncbi:MraZ C-terminal domain-containing protein [Hankyongella ginsenosidimutans]|uniref:MraZ C-terminal domain-containing protein n=1 Tax=Hankyongella ginsenosidimutans TaxID=1763828 RepID=UPI001CA3163C|nr:division/cell wall cluster transcriptional repressor MraZ [Hankyongella ginsenosidimutans]
MNYDDTGRIVLDPDLKQAVGINGLAFLIGIEDYFEIWNPYSFLREKGAGDHRLARKIRQKLAQKGEPMPEDLPA